MLAEIEKLEEFINDSEFCPAARFYRSNVLLALISKALTLGRAVCVLVQAGFPGEAFSLSRTLVEVFFNVRYISNKNTEGRAKKYAGYFTKTHESWTSIIQKHYPEKKGMPMPGFHERAMEMAKEYKSPHNWTGLGGQVKEMALESKTFFVQREANFLRAGRSHAVVESDVPIGHGEGSLVEWVRSRRAQQTFIHVVAML